MVLLCAVTLNVNSYSELKIFSFSADWPLKYLYSFVFITIYTTLIGTLTNWHLCYYNKIVSDSWSLISSSSSITSLPGLSRTLCLTAEWILMVKDLDQRQTPFYTNFSLPLQLLFPTERLYLLTKTGPCQIWARFQMYLEFPFHNKTQRHTLQHTI